MFGIWWENPQNATPFKVNLLSFWRPPPIPSLAELTTPFIIETLHSHQVAKEEEDKDDDDDDMISGDPR